MPRWTDPCDNPQHRKKQEYRISPSSGKRVKGGVRCLDCAIARRKRVGWTEAMSKAKQSHYNRVYRYRRYGIDKVFFDEMLLSQKGKCALCGAVLKKPHIDHDHDTGRVRGLLCLKCNTALGSLGDNIEGLQRALKYLGG